MPPLSLTDTLLHDYTPPVGPLDGALVYAILSDYPDPLSDNDLKAARRTLDALALDATEADPDWVHVGTGAQSPSHTKDDALAEGVGELSSRFEASSLASSADPDGEGEGEAASSTGSGNSQPRDQLDAGAGQRFWDKSVASLTSEEDALARSKALVWDLDGSAWDVPAEVDAPGAGADDDPLAFLASVFPDLDVAVLFDKLEARRRAEPNVDLDLEALVEELLSQELLASLAEDDARAEAETKAASLAAAGAGAGADRQQKRKLKAAQKAAGSFSLTSTPHLPSPSLSGQPPSAGETDLSAPALFSASSTSNAWASISSHASYLSTLLRLPASRITSTYYAQSSSLPRTLAVLLSQLSSDRPFSSLPNSSALKSQLGALVPPSPATRSEKAREDELEALLSATEGDVSDALDLHAFVASVQRDSGAPLAWSMLVARDAPSAAAGSAEVKRSSSEFVPVVAGRRRSPELQRVPLPVPSTFSAPASSAEKRYTADDCRRLAALALENRNAAFREAARAFQRGHGRGVGERGGATVWAEKGRAYERERRRWEEEAARRTVGERRAITGQNVVDLHGLTLSQALTVVDEACNNWWSASRETLSPPPLRIITGIGRHSRNQRAVLGPAVTRHLDKEGWRWKWDDGPLVAGGLPLRSGDTAQRGAVRVVGVK
ncbi:hypothetical protein JCM10207_003823 [Rhodosporidiobolus poonsookiae]